MANATSTASRYRGLRSARPKASPHTTWPSCSARLPQRALGLGASTAGLRRETFEHPKKALSAGVSSHPSRFFRGVRARA
jgi:hypothetical protein